MPRSRTNIVIGRVAAKSRSWFAVREEIRAAGWRDVATLGYPETAFNTAAHNFNIHARMLKGYIQRFVDAGEIELIAPHPDCYELSFAVTSGMSGAPLFSPNGDRQELLGVCVGSYSAEVTEYRSTLVEDDGRRLEERGVKVGADWHCGKPVSASRMDTRYSGRTNAVSSDFPFRNSEPIDQRRGRSGLWVIHRARLPRRGRAGPRRSPRCRR